MAISTTDVTAAVTSIQTISNQILSIIEATDPAVASDAATASSIVTLLGDLTTKALAALTAAQAETISAASIAADLTPDATPLTAPTS